MRETSFEIGFCGTSSRADFLFCLGYDQSLGVTAPPAVSQQSLSRQRTVSSSSSTHSHGTVGSQRRGSSPMSGTPQASNTPRSSRHASLSGGRVDQQTPSAGRSDNIFQFGVPPPPSDAYTVCFTALRSVAKSLTVLLLTY